MKNKIKPLGKEYKVEYVGDKMLAGNYGDSSTSRAYIRINKCISKQQQEDTLLHEVIHMLSNELKIGLEEEQVHRLATALYSVGVRI